MAIQTDAVSGATPAVPQSGHPRTGAFMAGRLRGPAPAALVIVVPAALGAALCFYGITSRSLGFDEAATVAIASRHGSALWSAIGHDGGNMSGYYVLLHVLIGLFGNTELLLRFPSALATGVTVALVGLIGLRLFDRRVAAAAGLLAAVSLPLVFWGQSARSYALLVALCAGSYLAFTAVLDARRPRLAWAAYVICTALALYMSLMAILILLAQMTALFWRRERLRPVGAAVITIIVSSIPLVLVATTRGSGQLFWVPRPDLTSEKQVLEAITSAGLQPNINATATTDVLMWVTTAALVGIGVTIVCRRHDRAPLLVLCWLVVPLLLAWLESLVGQPIFLARNLLLVLPAVALLLAWGITRPPLAPLAGLALLGALLALRALQVAPSYGVSPEGWQAASGYILARSSPAQCIAFYPSDGRQAFEYYVSSHARARAPRPVLPTAPFTQVRTFVEDYGAPATAQLASIRASCSQLWFVSSHVGRRTGPGGARAHYTRFVRLRSELERGYQRRLLASFGYADAVWVELLVRQ